MQQVERLQEVMSELRRRSLVEFARCVRRMDYGNLERSITVVLWNRHEVALNAIEKWIVVDACGFPVERLDAILEDVEARRDDPGEYARWRPVVGWRCWDAFVGALGEDGELPSV